MHHRVLAGLESRRKKFRPGHRPSDVRRSELTLYRYLTRFCSRNDTTGTAGTTIWGRWGEATSVIPMVLPTKTKVVYPSPRYVDLLANRQAWGPLREQATVVTNSYFRCPPETQNVSEKPSKVGRSDTFEQSETSSGTYPAVSGVLELLAKLDQSEVPFKALDESERAIALELLKQNWLGLRLGGIANDRLDRVRLACNVEAPLLTTLNRVEELRLQLISAKGRDYVNLMLEVDALTQDLAPYRSLDFFLILKWLILSGQDDERMLLQLAPSFDFQDNQLVDLRTSLTVPMLDWALPVLQACALPCSANLLKPLWNETCSLLLQGVLCVAGTDVPQGSQWQDYAPAIINGLCEMNLSGPRNRIANLLRLAWPIEPIFRHPVSAEAELYELLQTQMDEVPICGMDRDFLVCDSQRQVEQFSLSFKLKQRLEQALEPWFRFRAYSVYRDEQAIHKFMAQILPLGSEMPLSQFLLTVQSWSNSFRHLLSGNTVPFDLSFDREKLVVQLLEADEPDAGLDAWLKDKRLISTLDLMLSGTSEELDQGAGEIIVSEGHAGSEGLPQTTMFPAAHPDWDLAGYGTAVFGPNVLILQPPDLSKQSEGILIQLQDLTLGVRNPEAGWPNAKWGPVRDFSIRHDELGLCVSDGQKMLYRFLSNPWSIGDLRLISFSPKELSSWVTDSIPSFPHHPNPDIRLLPEVRLGDLVLSRRMVEMPAQLMATFMNEVIQDLKLPRYCFFKTGRKPMLVDFESEISRDVMLAELAKASQVTISPLLPGQEKLWLKLEDGHYCSEIRLAATWQGEHYAENPRSVLTA